MSTEVAVAWLVLFALVIAAPIALLVWRRRGSGPGADATDPLANRNYAAHGGPTAHYGGAGEGTQGWTIPSDGGSPPS